ncbi:MAG TPA: PAS domain-containing protein [Sphingobium sp.]|nr:PAS domain-containing protein [Sphingobium sp.]
MTTSDHDLLPDAASHDGDGLNAALVRDAAVPIIALDRQGAVLRCNEAAAHFCGYAMGHIAGRPLDQIIPDSHRPALARKLAAIWDGGPSGRFHGFFMTATGKTVAASMTASPARDESGTVIAASLIIHTRDSHPDNGTVADDQKDLRHKGSRPILVMDDEALMGLGLVTMLENAGFAAMGPARNLASATALLDRQPCALAILDTHLRGESSAPIARRLRADGIPFLVTSACPVRGRAPVFDGAPSLPRPWRTSRLVAAVHEALG